MVFSKEDIVEAMCWPCSQALPCTNPLFLYCKRQKVGWGPGNEASYVYYFLTAPWPPVFCTASNAKLWESREAYFSVPQMAKSGSPSSSILQVIKSLVGADNEPNLSHHCVDILCRLMLGHLALFGTTV